MSNRLSQVACAGACVLLTPRTVHGSIEETVAPQVLELMASWINQRFGRSERR